MPSQGVRRVLARCNEVVYSRFSRDFTHLEADIPGGGPELDIFNLKSHAAEKISTDDPRAPHRDSDVESAEKFLPADKDDRLTVDALRPETGERQIQSQRLSTKWHVR